MTVASERLKTVDKNGATSAAIRFSHAAGRQQASSRCLVWESMNAFDDVISGNSRELTYVYTCRKIGDEEPAVLARITAPLSSKNVQTY
jgi:hypothetical protein